VAGGGEITASNNLNDLNGGRGVGRGVAEAFAAAGAQVMLGARTLSYAEDAVAAIRAAGGIAAQSGATASVSAITNDAARGVFR
jgi:NAD(P)-dependent dehydrogenase (short-subunit alcohol dehydrogenase family)